MEWLPQIVKLMEVLSFLVEKLPSELKTKDKYEEYLKVVTQIVEGCSGPLENLNVREDYDHEEGQDISEEEGVISDIKDIHNIANVQRADTGAKCTVVQT